MSEEKFGLPWPDALNQREDLIAECLGIFQAIDHYSEFTVSQLAYFQFPVISNKEKFVLALVKNIIFSVIYFYDNNPLRLSQIPGNALKDMFCFHAAHSVDKVEKQLSKAFNEVKDKNSY